MLRTGRDGVQASQRTPRFSQRKKSSMLHTIQQERSSRCARSRAGTRGLGERMLSAWAKPGFGSVVVTCSGSPEPPPLVILVRVTWTRCRLYAGHHGGPVTHFFSHHSALGRGAALRMEEEFKALRHQPWLSAPTFPKKGLPFSPSRGLRISNGAGFASEALSSI